MLHLYLKQSSPPMPSQMKRPWAASLRSRPATRLAALPALFATLPALLAGCAAYRPAALTELPPQQRVRMLLAPDELARHILFAGSSQGFVNGRFVEVRGDSAVFVLTSSTAHSQVSLPVESILRLERKDVRHGRSLLLSAVLVGGVATLAYLGFEGEENTGPDPDDDLTDQLVPGIRIVIPLGR